MQKYHFEFIERASKLIDFHKKIVLEVGCGNGEMLKTIAKKFKPRFIVGIDNNLGYWSISESKHNNWQIANGNVSKLNYPDNHFDVVISVGTFEHVQDLGSSFAEIKRVLKPTGIFYTEFSPIWTSIIGHHYNFWIKKEAKLIPPWGHLWMTEDEMLVYLEKLIGRDNAQKACYDIYHNNYINRLKFKDYYNVFTNCGLGIRELKEHISYSRTIIFGGTESELTRDIYKKLQRYYSLNELAVMGFTILFEKHGLD